LYNFPLEEEGVGVSTITAKASPSFVDVFDPCEPSLPEGEGMRMTGTACTALSRFPVDFAFGGVCPEIVSEPLSDD
jgi:hypothetical protein